MPSVDEKEVPAFGEKISSSEEITSSEEKYSTETSSHSKTHRSANSDPEEWSDHSSVATYFDLIDRLLSNDASLVDIDLGQAKLGDKGATTISEVLKTNTKIQSLDLTFNNIESKGAAAISEAFGWIEGCDRYHRENGGDIPSIEEEEVTDEDEDKDKEDEEQLEESEKKHDEDVDKDKDPITNIEYRIEGNDNNTIAKVEGDDEKECVPDFVPHPMKACSSSLLAIDLSENPIGPHTSAEFLRAAVVSLEEIRAVGIGAGWLGAFGVAHGLEEVETCPLRCLDLSHNNIEDKGAVRLAQALKHTVKRESAFDNTGPVAKLRALFLNNNGIGPTGVSALCDALRFHKHIEVLQLRFNRIRVDGAAKVSSFIRYNKTITHLDLRSCALGDKGSKRLGSALESSQGIRSLWLAGNQIGEKGGKYIFLGLQHNKTITELDLHSNFINDEATKALCGTLEENVTLQMLNLRDNKVNCAGASNIAKGLSKNGTLQYLDLSRNTVANVGACDLASALSASMSMRKLDISDNAIGAKGGSALEACRSSSLEKRMEQHNQLQRERLEEIKRIKEKQAKRKKKHLQKIAKQKAQRRAKVFADAVSNGKIKMYSFSDDDLSDVSNSVDESKILNGQDSNETRIIRIDYLNEAKTEDDEMISSESDTQVQEEEIRLHILSNAVEPPPILEIEMGNERLLTGNPGFLHVSPKEPDIYTELEIQCMHQYTRRKRPTVTPRMKHRAQTTIIRKHKKHKYRQRSKTTHQRQTVKDRLKTVDFKWDDNIPSRPSTNHTRLYTSQSRPYTSITRPHTHHSRAYTDVLRPHTSISRAHTNYSIYTRPYTSNTRPYTSRTDISAVSFTDSLTDYFQRDTHTKERDTRKLRSLSRYSSLYGDTTRASTTSTKSTWMKSSVKRRENLLDMSPRPYSRQRGIIGTPLYSKNQHGRPTSEKGVLHVYNRPKTIRRHTKSTSTHLWMETTNASTKHSLYEAKEQAEADRLALIEEKKAEREAKKKKREEEMKALLERGSRSTTTSSVTISSRSSTRGVSNE